MAVEIVTSGLEDRNETPWQIAIGGYPGAGKSMFASTAPDPLFLFFAENPRLKSVADRGIKYAKIVNDYDEDGVLVEPVLSKLLAVVRAIRNGDVECGTLVLDTADEYFYALKEQRTATNGEFSGGDWNWIADFFRESITSIVDLPVNVIVLFHLKRASGEDGELLFEPALQGSSKEEFPGWLDVVGVLETVETDEGAGRVLLTSGIHKYPWLKDHSGDLPPAFKISDGFVGDYDGIMEYLRGPKSSTLKEVQRGTFKILNTVENAEEDEETEEVPVPTPEELHEKKQEQSSVLTEAIERVKEIGGEVVEDTCANCSNEIDNMNIAALAKEKFDKALCRECFKKENA